MFRARSSSPRVGMRLRSTPAPDRCTAAHASLARAAKSLSAGRSTSTAYAIEGNIKALVPEWNNQLVQIKLEQSAVFDGKKVTYLAGRQTAWHVVK